MSSVAIVMATYNGEKYVGEQIKSILSSTYQDFELFIYDDGSKDETMTILKEYESIHPDKIHVRQNENNLGVTRNFLQGVCETTTEYIMLCDQDDVWKPNKIENTMRRLRQMEKSMGKDTPIAVFSDTTVVDKNLMVLQNSFFKASHLNQRKIDLPHLLMENKLIGCTVMINAALRKILKGHQLPTNARFHDGWIALIAAAFGKIGYLNEATLLYRQHGNNVVGNISFIDYIKNRISSIKKQKETLLMAQQQAAEFCALYKELLSEENCVTIKRFSNLHKVNMVKRKYQVLRYRYLKTGIIRNIGLIILI